MRANYLGTQSNNPFFVPEGQFDSKWHVNIVGFSETAKTCCDIVLRIFQTISEELYAEFFKKVSKQYRIQIPTIPVSRFCAASFALTEKRSLICGSFDVLCINSAFLLTTLWETRDVVRILKLKSLKLCMRKSNKSRINSISLSLSLFSSCVHLLLLLFHIPPWLNHVSQ